MKTTPLERLGTAMQNPITWYTAALLIGFAALGLRSLFDPASNAGVIALALIAATLWTTGWICERRQARARAHARDRDAIWGIGTAALRADREVFQNLSAKAAGEQIHRDFLAQKLAADTFGTPLPAMEFPVTEFAELPPFPRFPEELPAELVAYHAAVAAFHAEVEAHLQTVRSLITPAVAIEEEPERVPQANRDLLPNLQEVMLADVARTLDLQLAELRARAENPRVWDEVGYLVHDLLFLATGEVPDVVMGVDGELQRRPDASEEPAPTIEPGTKLAQYETGEWVIASDVERHQADSRWPIRTVDRETGVIIGVILNPVSHRDPGPGVLSVDYSGCTPAHAIDATPPGVPDNACDERR